MNLEQGISLTEVLQYSKPNGGWNHSEMMRYERIYTEDDGTPDTPLKRNRTWINSKYE